MPLDPNIPLSVRGPELRDPFTTMGSIFQLRAQQENAAALREQRLAMADHRRLQMEADRRKLADDAARRNAFSGPRLTRETVVQRLQQSGAAHLVPDVLKDFDEIDKRAVDLRTARAGALEKEQSYLAGLAASVARRGYDPTAFEVVLQHAEDMFEDYRPMAAQIREQIKAGGPDAIKQIVDGIIAQNPQQASEARQADEWGAKRPGVVAKSAFDVRQEAAGRLAAAGTREAYEAIWDELPAGIAKAFPPPEAFDPKSTPNQVRAVGMTPDQQRSAEQRAEELRGQAAGRAETARHNRATEANQLKQTEPLEAIIENGESVLVPRSQAVGKKPATTRERPTEDERKSAGFYAQMRDAIATLDALEDQLSERELYQIQSMPQEGLIGLMNRGKLSTAAQRYVRAFEQFTEARLRPVSGAAISDSEFARDRRTYARQYSETPELNADRRRAREIQLQSLRERAGIAMPKTSAAPDATAGGSDTVPEDVSAALTGRPDGRYTGKDGSVWIVEGGHIRKGT